MGGLTETELPSRSERDEETALNSPTIDLGHGSGALPASRCVSTPYRLTAFYD